MASCCAVSTGTTETARAHGSHRRRRGPGGFPRHLDGAALTPCADSPVAVHPRRSPLLPNIAAEHSRPPMADRYSKDLFVGVQVEVL
jgi:hypothetical protein